MTVPSCEPCLLELESRDGADEIDDAALAAAFEEPQGALDLGVPERVPAALHADQRLLRGRELGQLLLGEDGVADRELPVEGCESLGREEPARVDGAAVARRGQVDAKAAGRRDPVARKQDRDPALLELGHRLAEEEPDGVVVELDRRRLAVVESDPAVGEERLDLAELAVERDPRIAGAEEGEDRVAAVVEEGDGEGEGRVVGRLQPELEPDCRRDAPRRAAARRAAG